MNGDSPKRESSLPEDDLVARLRVLVQDQPTNAQRATIRRAADEIMRLRAVADAARTLVQSVTDTGCGFDDCLVPESAITNLETALAGAGLDMTDEEFAERIGREPPEDGECFRGGEAAAYLAEQQDAARRLK